MVIVVIRLLGTAFFRNDPAIHTICTRRAKSCHAIPRKARQLSAFTQNILRQIRELVTPHKYQKSHSESKFPIFIKIFYLLGAPHFSGMILVENLGYSTPVLSLSLFPVKSYSPSLRRVKHYHIQDFEFFFFRLRSLQLLCQVKIISENQRTLSWANRLLSVLSTGKNS